MKTGNIIVSPWPGLLRAGSRKLSLQTKVSRISAADRVRCVMKDSDQIADGFADGLRYRRNPLRTPSRALD